MCGVFVKTYFNKTQWGSCKKSAPKYYLYQSLCFLLWWWAYNVPTPMPIMPLPLWVYTKEICTQLVGCCVFWWIFCIVLWEDGLVKKCEWFISRIFTSLKIPVYQRTLNRFLLPGILRCCFVCVLRAPAGKPRLVVSYIVWSFHVW